MICIVLVSGFLLGQGTFLLNYSGRFTIESAPGSGYFLQKDNTLTRINESGNAIWVRTYGYSPGFAIAGFTVTPQGNPVFLGLLSNTQGDKINILMTDTAGIPLWSRENTSAFTTFTSGPPSSYVDADSFRITAIRNIGDTIRIFQFDHNGNELYKTVISFDSICGMPICVVNNGNAKFTSSTRDLSGNYYFTYQHYENAINGPIISAGIVKTDSALNIMWIRHLGGGYMVEAECSFGRAYSSSEFLLYSNGYTISPGIFSCGSSTVDTSAATLGSIGFTYTGGPMRVVDALRGSNGNFYLLGNKMGSPAFSGAIKPFVLRTDGSMNNPYFRSFFHTPSTNTSYIFPSNITERNGQLFISAQDHLGKTNSNMNNLCYDTAFSFPSNTGGPGNTPPSANLRLGQVPFIGNFSGVLLTTSNGSFNPQILCFTNVENETGSILQPEVLYSRGGGCQFYCPEPLLNGKLELYSISGKLEYSCMVKQELTGLDLIPRSSGIFLVRYSIDSQSYSLKFSVLR